MIGKSENKLVFGGWPVTMRVVSMIGDKKDVLINCKNVTGSYSQLLSFVKKDDLTGRYKFGVKTTKIATIDLAPNGEIEIACLRDSKVKFTELFNVATKLLEES